MKNFLLLMVLCFHIALGSVGGFGFFWFDDRFTAEQLNNNAVSSVDFSTMVKYYGLVRTRAGTL